MVFGVLGFLAVALTGTISTPMQRRLLHRHSPMHSHGQLHWQGVDPKPAATPSEPEETR